mgnify:CR=1 FL=1
MTIFWIATSWLATGLYFAPALSGKEPRGQKLGVNVLFIALLIVVAGSLAGQWMGVMQKLGLAENFWFGHMGYEYVDLGRFWQILLFVGLFLWLFLMGRALVPALKQRSEKRQLLLMFVVASIAIALFYGAALMWGRGTNLAVAEYWRWWVVHLWVKAYKWPIYSFIALAFWNFLGATIFGFLINPPIALYYMQGLNTTPVHGHTALFGVYGMLGIGLMLFVLREVTLNRTWKEKPIKFAFWSINIGLLAMVTLSVLPVGLAQTWVSVKEGLWYARSAEFMQLPVIDTLKWMRVIGDTIFAAGSIVLVWFVFGLKYGWSLNKESD